MDLLKELALKGKLIFVVIHQPSSEIYKMFDKLMILDVGGYPIYYGNPVDAVSYFKRLVNHVNAEESECWNCGNVNPEQIFNIIESKVLDEYGNLTYNRKVSPAEWNVQYRERIESNIHSEKKHTEIPESIFKIPNIIKQFKVFMTRDVKSKLTNTQYLLINFLEAPVLAFILAYLVRFYNTDVDTNKGYVFGENENIPAYMFMSVVVALFIGLTVSAEEIIRDRKIRKRESFLNLSKGSYLWSKIIIMFALSAVQTLTFVIVGNYVLGIKGMYTDYWMVLFTTSCFANMLGLNISSAFNSAVTIYILIPFLIIPQLLLAGVVVKFDKLNPTLAAQGSVPISGEVMTSRWAFEALAVNQFKENAYEHNFYKYDKSISVAQFKKDYWMPKLESKLVKIENEIREGKKLNEIKADITLLFNEISKETKINKKVACDVLKQINEKDYSPAVVLGIKAYLTNIKNYYINVQNTAYKKLDEIKLSMQKTPAEKEKFLQLAANFDNENLNNLVKNSGELNRCIEKDGKLIQQIDPVYQDPIDSKIGRAHFFAPRKNFFGTYFSTYWFNVCVIWMMSILLIITLYFDIFKKVMDSLGNIKFPRRKN
jgi:hypothetical protein